MKKLKLKIGESVMDLFPLIAFMNPSIVSLDFFSYHPEPNLKDRPSPTSTESLLYHRKAKASFFVLRKELLGGDYHSKMADIFNKAVHQEFAIAFLSKVHTKNKRTLHIPIMDFSCEPTERNAQSIKELMRRTGQKDGMVFSSGRSFHYYGLHLLPKQKWIKFMLTCQLFVGFTDQGYITHSLIDECAALRISPRKEGGHNSYIMNIED